ncbi:ParB/Srx family N-terminal domain-containing protein [Azospira oryzae]|uniref:ParB/Srx family N-terminal domain-containing protein n=1 Tax=Azospira oryzae TaxID=146939 RepID=UPI001966C347|nr:ParB/Srx family N-terminal domain-containing protein [Azospira oryzae]
MAQAVVELSLDLLDFDPSNPRFPRSVNEGPEDLLVERMAREERVLELMESIGEQGYFPGEPLIAVRHGDGRYYVAEGNRRLAALKLLSGHLAIPARLTTLLDAKESAQFKPTSVPCLVFDDVDQVLRYLGFRHITGVKPWKPIAKARYLERLRQSNMYRGLDHDTLLRRLAKEIGSRHDYVGQMLTSLAVLDYAQANDFFGIQRIDPDRIDFSLLSTALSYENIYRHIGLESRKDIDAPNINKNNASELFVWLYSQRDDNTTVLGESRNLEQLAKIIGNEHSLAELRESRDLASAYRLTSGPQEALGDALQEVKKTLEAAFKLLGKHVKLTSAHESAADDAFELARSIRNLIRDRREDAR